MDAEFVRLDEVRGFELAPGVIGRPLFGEDGMLNLVEIEAGSVVALHSHPQEQLGVVLRGEMRLTVAGVEHVLSEMDAYVVPGGIEHGATFGPEGAVVLDVFVPLREDYRERWDVTGNEGGKT
jgi:quercetin dioxygenase-like cupin family protein